MTEVKRKGIGKAKVGLAVFAILAIILTISNVWVYTNLKNQISALETDKTTLNDQMGTLQTEKSSLEIQVNSLQNQKTQLQNDKTNLQNQINSLNSEISSLEASKLIRVNLEETDVRPWLGTPYLHLRSVVVNVGSNTAYNCKLHVVLYQGATIAKDTYVLLGSILGEEGVISTNDVQYVGSALTGWTVTLEWTS